VVGRSLGHYEILGPLGAGGMGEVYRARDTQLGRDVAIKVLPEDLADDPDRLARQKREAHLLAALNHPGIATIHSLEESDGTHFLVMELVKGESLKERLAQGPLSVAEALDVCRQIAEALEAAHAENIVHRDLKPANVLVTPEGRAKVLDFGLAKMVGAAARDDDMSRSPTVTVVGTQTGMILGTAPYMSPEQVRGQALDKRADIWAFGCVLYEALVGQRAFDRETVADTLAAIIDQQPDWEAVQSVAGPTVVKLLHRCLDKDVDRRLHDIADARIELEDALELISGNVARGPGIPGSTIGKSGRVWLVVATLFAGALLAALASGLLSDFGLRLSPPANPDGPRVMPAVLRRSVAVMGFKNLSGSADMQWLSTALSEMLSTELSAGEQLRVISGEDIARVMLDLSLTDSDGFARDTLARIRTNLGADLVALGSFTALGQEAGGQLRLDLRLQDAALGETIAAFAETGVETELFELVTAAGTRLRAKLGLLSRSAQEAAAVRASLPSNPDAVRLYSEGLASLRVYEAVRARDLLEASLAIEPDFPLSHSALAVAWTRLGYDAEAEAEAKRALELSEGLRREERLLVEARYYQLAGDLSRTIDIYETLWTFFPGDIDHGLRVGGAQIEAWELEAADETIAALRQLPPPAGEDPRIDLLEAGAANASGNYERAREAASGAAQAAMERGTGLLLARARVAEAGALARLGKPEEALKACEEAERLYADAGDLGGAAGAIHQRGLVLWVKGDVDGARQVFEEVHEVRRETGNKRGMAGAANNIAVCLNTQGDPHGAKERYEEARSLYREIGDPRGEALAVGNIGMVLRDLGDFDAAQTMYERALEVFEALGSQDDVAWAYNSLAVVHALRGDLNQAQGMFARSLQIRREIGEKSGIAQAINNLARVLYQKGDLGGSFQLNEESLAIAAEIENQAHLAHAMAGLADVQAARGELEAAVEAHEEVLAIRRQLGDNRGAAESQMFLADLALEDGRPAEAETMARQALAEFREHQAIDSEASALASLALALSEQGRVQEALADAEEAQRLLASSDSLDTRLANSPLIARVLASAGRHADALATLSAALSAAKQAGFVTLRLEITLAIGEIEISSGQTAAGNRRLTALREEAAALGFELLARKATQRQQRSIA